MINENIIYLKLLNRKEKGKVLKMLDLISVIVPVYNCVKYVDTCIASILQQEYENIELILVDDGSTDGSGGICDIYAKQDERIKVFHKENGGVSAARNRGIKEASGKWYSFIDADDFLDKDMYSTLLKLQKETNADIVHCGYRRIEKNRVVYASDSGNKYIQDAKEAIEYLIDGSKFSNALWTKLFNACVIRNISFDEKLKMNEDVLFNFEAFRHAQKIAYIDIAKYNYIVHDDSACFTIDNEKKLLDVCNVSNYMLQCLEKSDIVSTARTRYIQMMILYFRFCYKKKQNKEQVKEIAKEIWEQISKGDIINKNIVWSSKLIHWCPCLYCLFHDIYEYIKKPKWT